ncbi:MAG: hypothetical protein D6714_11615, partial [Bacteroidetes bacterium]
ILNLDDHFPNNTSWRFVPKNYVFPNPDNPFNPPFPEAYYNVPSGDTLSDLDFVAIKIGDLNFSANPHALTSAEDRNLTGEVPFWAPAIDFAPGQTVVLPFRPGAADLAGYQATLWFDPTRLRLKDLLPGFSGAGDFGMKKVGEGQILTSWVGDPPAKGALAFALVFEATGWGNTRDLVGFSSEKIAAEAYTDDLEKRALRLYFADAPADKDLAIWDNQPNPFSDETRIPFYLPEKKHLEWSVFRSDGTLIISGEKWFEAGAGELRFTRAQLGRAGVYFYRIKVNETEKTGRMVLFSE